MRMRPDRQGRGPAPAPVREASRPARTAGPAVSRGELSILGHVRTATIQRGLWNDMWAAPRLGSWLSSGAGRPQLRVVGPSARAPVMREALADATGRPVRMPRDIERIASAWGAAALAIEALGKPAPVPQTGGPPSIPTSAQAAYGPNSEFGEKGGRVPPPQLQPDPRQPSLAPPGPPHELAWGTPRIRWNACLASGRPFGTREGRPG